MCCGTDRLQNHRSKTLSTKLNLNSLYEDPKKDRLKIAEIRNLWAGKKIKMSFDEFYKWYLFHERRCFYCDKILPDTKDV